MAGSSNDPDLPLLGCSRPPIIHPPPCSPVRADGEMQYSAIDVTYLAGWNR
jgi:hypothetical protein